MLEHDIEQRERARQVAIEVQRRLLDRFADADLAGEVRVRRDLVLADHARDQRLVGDVAAHERDPIGQRRLRPRRQIIEDDDATARLVRRSREVQASRRTSYLPVTRITESRAGITYG